MADEKPEELEEYTVVINGLEHTMQLDAETAERYGEAATKVSTKAKTPANKGK